MSVHCGRCAFVEDAKISKLRSSGVMYWCVNHSVRTTSAMKECRGAERGEIESHKDWNAKYPVKRNNHIRDRGVI
jgi:hypothetical protein